MLSIHDGHLRQASTSRREWLRVGRDHWGHVFSFAMTVADSLDEFEKIITNFRLRLVLYRFQNMQKDPRTIQELASVDFRPVFGESREFVLDRFLGSTTPGANFSIGCGLGVLIAMETTTPLTLPTDQSRRFAVREQSVELTFNPRQRDDSVTV